MRSPDDSTADARSLEDDAGSRPATERLMTQMREANERLVLTTIDAQAST